MDSTQLTDEQAAAIWSGDTASIMNLGSTESEDEKSGEDKSKAASAENIQNDETPVFTDNDISNALAGVYTPEEDEENDIQTNSNDEVVKSKGRKPTDLVFLVNQLIADEVLEGYEDPTDSTKIAEIKTIDEAKELIKDNLKSRSESSSEEGWKKKKESYSPQVQAIIDYADAGGQDVNSLLSAISQVEKSVDLDVETEEGQKEIIKEVFRLKGLDDDEINEQIETFTDLGKLKAKAEKFLPELNEKKAERVKMMLEAQEKRNNEAKEASKIYQQTLINTLKKDEVGGLKLKKEEKAKLYEALVVPKYKSLNGGDTNAFVKALEDMQFGEKQDYDHFMNIVHLAIDRQGFMDKMKETLKNETVVEQVKKLKSAKSSNANSETENNNSNTGKKKTITSTFKNPFA